MIFDLIILTIILISVGIAFFRGFIKETLTIVGVVGGFFAALYFSPKLSPVLKDWIGTEAEDGTTKELLGVVPYPIMLDVASYALIFIVVVIVLSIISYFISKSVDAAGLGAVDRTFGVLFGIARGVLLIALLYLPVYMLVDKENRDEWFANMGWLQDSKTRVYIEKSAEMIEKMIPKDFKKEMEQTQTELEAKSEQTREKLKALDVLKSETDRLKAELENQSDDNNADANNTDAPQNTDGESGYNETQNEQLNELIEKEYNE